MCISVGPLYKTQRSPVARLWWLVAGEPLRLYLVGTIAAALVLMPLSLRTLPLLLLLPLCGWILKMLPQWSGRSEIHYLNYLLILVLLLSSAVSATPGHLQLATVFALAAFVMFYRQVEEHRIWFRAVMSLQSITLRVFSAVLALTLIGAQALLLV